MSDIKNQIRLMPVKDLLGMNFFIPGYQRGYRWKTRQVEDLLDDIYEFVQSGKDGKYCLQPLVVKDSDSTSKGCLLDKLKEALKEKDNDIQSAYQVLKDYQRWDVVDGQQRLTTIYILLSYLDETAPYTLQYETRNGSQKFLENIRNSQNTNDSPKATDNIDYWHMANTYQVINSWFSNGTKNEDNFKEYLLERTEFIWYETAEDPIEVFTRLNIGKISLTNAELVKALFLNKANYGNQYIASLQQNEIALEWDRIEYTLQKNEFWNFIHNNEYNQPTRIDFILDLVVKLKNKSYWKVEKKLIGTDEYKTFRYFYQLFERVYKNKTNKGNFISSHNDIWNEIKKTFDLFVEWYNDLEFYHYIGFLVVCSERDKKNFNFEGCFNVWYNGKENSKAKKYDTNKTGFVEYLKDNIKEAIKITIKKDKLNDNTITDWGNMVFDQEDGGLAKTACFPLLLLFNVQTIINRNLQFKTDSKFNSTDFQRFPFHLFKNEKGWDIEHIAPNTENDLDGIKEREAWLESAKYGAEQEIEKWKEDKLEKKDDWVSKVSQDSSLFEELREKLEEGNLKVGDERNKIWNFCLLDQSTNRSYGNSIFASKRKEILLRDQGLNKDGNPSEERVFILECTKNVFTKSYSADVNDLRAWGEEDAKQYLECIKNTLDNFKLDDNLLKK